MNLQWIPGFMLLAVLIGALATFGLAGTDLLNPVTSQAKAERINIETRHLDAMNRLEEQLAVAKTEQAIARIRHEMAMEETRYQAELARIAADQAYYARMLKIKADAFQGGIVLLFTIVGIGSVGVVIIGVKFALAHIPVQAGVPFSTTIKHSSAQLDGYFLNHHPQNIKKRNNSHIHQAVHSHNGYRQKRINARQCELLSIEIINRRLCAVCNVKNMPSEEYRRFPLAAD